MTCSRVALGKVTDGSVVDLNGARLGLAPVLLAVCIKPNGISSCLFNKEGNAAASIAAAKDNRLIAFILLLTK
jgi:hypothetical protein